MIVEVETFKQAEMRWRGAAGRIVGRKDALSLAFWQNRPGKDTLSLAFWQEHGDKESLCVSVATFHAGLRRKKES